MADFEQGYPDFCKTREELDRAGISFDDPVVDTVCRRGPGRTFFIYFSVMAACFALLWAVPGRFMIAGLAGTLKLGAAFCLLNSLYILGRWLYFLCLRSCIRRRAAPVPIEPVGVALETGRRGWIYHGSGARVRCYVVYREAGVAAPKYYAAARTYEIPETMPYGVALLYRHPEGKGYSVDNERARREIRERGTVSV